jgi:hypothetical protein
MLMDVARYVDRTGEYTADAHLYEHLASLLPDARSLVPFVQDWRRAYRGLNDRRLGLLSLGKSTETMTRSCVDARVPYMLETMLREVERHLAGEQFLSRIVVYDGKLHFHGHRSMVEHVRARPIVLLNATADVKALRQLLETPDYHVDECSPQVGLHVGTTVRYVLEANHSKSYVRTDDAYRARWVERIRSAVAEAEQALVVATKESHGQLKEDLSDLVASKHIKLDYYGNVSGRNDYSDIGCIVLVQPFNPSPVAVAERYRSLHTGEVGEPLRLDPDYRRQALEWHDEVGRTYEVGVTSMADRRLAPIYEHWRWSEMLQAAHRVRPIENPWSIVVLCSIPL